MEQDATDKILDAVAAVDKKIDDSNRANDVRFRAVETELALHGHAIEDTRIWRESHTRMLNEQAEFVTRVSGAAARAVDLALEAKREATRSVGEATQIVESAIRMHSASIGATVQSAVKAELAPVVVKVAAIGKSDEEQTQTLATIMTMVTGIVKSVGHPVLRWVLIICAGVGAIGGGFYTGYIAKRGTDAIGPAPPRAEPTTTPITPTPLMVEVSFPDASADASNRLEVTP